MKKKLGILVIVLVFAFSTMGMSYANNNYAQFVQSSSWDNEVGKNVGTVSAYIDNPGNLIISLSNAYPGYEAYVSFRVQHIGVSGDPTIYLKYINITNNFPTVMNILVTDPMGDPIPINYPLGPGDTLDGLITITMKQGAEEEKLYSFNIQFDFSNELF